MTLQLRRSRRFVPATEQLSVTVLVVCRPRPGIAGDEIAAHAPAEMAALRQLKRDGVLLEASSPGSPGAILLIDNEQTTVEDMLDSLPLLRHRLIDAEVIELHPFAGLPPE